MPTNKLIIFTTIFEIDHQLLQSIHQFEITLIDLVYDNDKPIRNSLGPLSFWLGVLYTSGFKVPQIK